MKSWSLRSRVVIVGIVVCLMMMIGWFLKHAYQEPTDQGIVITVGEPYSVPVAAAAERTLAEKKEKVATPESEIREEINQDDMTQIYRAKPELTRGQILYFLMSRVIGLEYDESISITWDEFANQLAEDFTSQNEDTSAFLESVYKRIMERDPELSSLVARQISIIPGGSKAFKNLGEYFVKKYQDFDWDAQVIVYQGTKHTDRVYKNGNTDGLKSEMLYSEPLSPKRDTQGRLLTCENGEMADINLNFCPPMTLSDIEKEDNWRKIDKIVYRAGPKFFQNAKWFYERTMAELEKIKD